MAESMRKQTDAFSDFVVVGDSEYGDGVYAKRAFKEGELVEFGPACRLLVDGQKWDMVFTWADDRSVWAHCSVASVFYNTSLDPNTHMTRYLDEDRFEIHACKDIQVGEELTHTYRSLLWRECFESLPQDGDAAPAAEAAPPAPTGPAPVPATKVDCSKVFVKGGAAVAAQAITAGEEVEFGVVRMAPTDLSWATCAVSWAEDNSTWATVSGNLMCYTHEEASPNVGIQRQFEQGRFSITALRDIPAGGALLLDFPGRAVPDGATEASAAA